MPEVMEPFTPMFRAWLEPDDYADRLKGRRRRKSSKSSRLGWESVEDVSPEMWDRVPVGSVSEASWDDMTEEAFTPDSFSVVGWDDISDEDDKPVPPKRKRDVGASTIGSPVLVFDTETTVDLAQNLTFGVYRWGIRTEDGIDVHEEGLFYGDDLDVILPGALDTLTTYVGSHSADVSTRRVKGISPLRSLRLMSRGEFVEDVFIRALRANALIVGFNLPFDLSRLAVDARPGVGLNFNGFRLLLSDKKHGLGIRVKSYDSKKARISADGAPGFMSEETRWKSGGRFVDCRTLSFALSNISLTLAGAAEKWGVSAKSGTEEYGSVTSHFIDYARQDVKTTTELAHALISQWESYGLPLPVDYVMSPATVAKQELKAMGIVPPLQRQPDFSREVLAAAMESFFGARSEVHIRLHPLPVSVHDFTSMYPTCNSLLGLWSLLTAERIVVDRNTETVQRFLDTVTLDALLDDRALWPMMRGFARVLPSRDILPVRADFDGSNGAGNIAVGYVSGYLPRWYAIPDLVASAILTGKAPTVVEAFTLHGEGTPTALRSVKMGDGEFDPRTDDFFVRVIEARNSLPDKKGREGERLKCLANSGSYGIFSEFVVEDGAKPVRSNVRTADESFIYRTTHPEVPGSFCFPPIAALITSSARLMLALLERLVTDSGGTWVFMDTDSMAVVCTPEGGLIPCPGGEHVDSDGRECVKALSDEEMASIRSRIDRLSPYNDSVKHLLKPEYSAYSYAISAKRYAVYLLDEDGRPSVAALRKATGDGPKEHGLGHLIPPTLPQEKPLPGDTEMVKHKWTDSVWQTLLSREYGDESEEYPWHSVAALSRQTVSSAFLWRHFRSFNDGRPWRERVKPFNFVLSANVTRIYGHINESVVAPYSSDRSRPEDLGWFSKQTRTPVVFNDPDDPVVIDDMSRVVAEYVRSREKKFNDKRGNPCATDTRGVLFRKHVALFGRRHIGKEARNVSEVASQWLPESDVVNTYAESSPLSEALPILREIGAMPLHDMVANAVSERVELVRGDIDREFEWQSGRLRTERSTNALRARIHAEHADRLLDAETSGLSLRSIREIIAGRQETRNPLVVDVLLRAAADYATEALTSRGITVSNSQGFGVVGVWKNHSGPAVLRECACGCGEISARKSRYFSNACRRRAQTNGAASPRRTISAVLLGDYEEVDISDLVEVGS